MQVEVITDREGAGGLGPEWSRLAEAATAPSVFLTPEWLLSWWDAYGSGLGMRLLTVRDAGVLTAVIPMAVRVVPGLPGRRRVLQGWSNDYTDRFGPIVDAGARDGLESAVRRLADLRWDRLRMLPLSGSDPATGWLTAALGAVGIGAVASEWWRSPIVDLPSDPDDLRARLSGSFRSTLRRKEQRAEAAGLAVEVRTDAAALDEAFGVAGESWAHRAGTAIGSTPGNLGFFRALASAAENRGWLRIALLREPGGRAIAFELNLLRGGSAVNLKLGYREGAADLSPGLVLRGGVIDALIAEGADTFDLLGSEEPYKMHWTDRTVPHYRIRGYPPTLRGRARHAYRNRLRPAVGRAVSRLPVIGGRR